MNLKNQARALRLFAKCARGAMYYADCHPRYIAASRRMHALRDAYRLDAHPQWEALAAAIKSNRARAVQGL